MLLRDAERPLTAKDLPTIVAEVEQQHEGRGRRLDFEPAALLRDQLYELKSMSASKAKGGKTTSASKSKKRR